VKGKSSNIYILFLLLYAVAYMGHAVYTTFFPVYLDNIGLSKTSIATLLSIGPLVAILAQPVWGSIGDRSKKKNQVLQLLLFGSGISVLLLSLSDHYIYLMVIICLVSFFQTSIYPISDALTLEYLSETNWNFGPIRLAGTVGFAIMSVLFGMLVKEEMTGIFIVYCTVMLLAVLICFCLPKVKGHQSGGKKVSMWVLFKNRKLVLFLAISFIVQVTLGYYYAFFPIYYREMGADNALLGWSMVISAMSELPFLLFAHKLIKKFGIPIILLSTAFFAGLRWLLLYFVNNPYMVLPIQMLHGALFIVLTVTMAMFINEEVPKELKASGQTLYGLISVGVSRVVGSIIGGVTSDYVGLRDVFFYNSLIAFVALIIFSFIFAKEMKFAQNISAEKY